MMCPIILRKCLKSLIVFVCLVVGLSILAVAILIGSSVLSGDVCMEVMNLQPGMKYLDVAQKVLGGSKWQQMSVSYEPNIYGTYCSEVNPKSCAGISVYAKRMRDGWLFFTIEAVDLLFDNRNRLVWAECSNGNSWRPGWAENGSVVLRSNEGGLIFPLHSISEIEDKCVASSNGVVFVRVISLLRNKNAEGIPVRFEKRPKVFVRGKAHDEELVRVEQQSDSCSDRARFDIEVDERFCLAHATDQLNIEFRYEKPSRMPPVVYEFDADKIVRLLKGTSGRAL